MAQRITAHLLDIEDADKVLLTANRSLSKAGLAIHGTNAYDALTANAISFIVNGIFYSKAAMASIAAATLGGAAGALDETGASVTMSALATGYDQAFLLLLNAAGTVKAIQGPAVVTGASVPVPGVPPLYASFGLIKVRNASGSNFVFGTTNFSASNVTTTFYDVSLSPGVI